MALVTKLRLGHAPAGSSPSPSHARLSSSISEGNTAGNAQDGLREGMFRHADEAELRGDAAPSQELGTETRRIKQLLAIPLAANVVAGPCMMAIPLFLLDRDDGPRLRTGERSYDFRATFDSSSCNRAGSPILFGMSSGVSVTLFRCSGSAPHSKSISTIS